LITVMTELPLWGQSNDVFVADNGGSVWKTDVQLNGLAAGTFSRLLKKSRLSAPSGLKKVA
jgi:hypothetical protein